MEYRASIRSLTTLSVASLVTAVSPQLSSSELSSITTAPSLAISIDLANFNDSLTALSRGLLLTAEVNLGGTVAQSFIAINPSLATARFALNLFIPVFDLSTATSSLSLTCDVARVGVTSGVAMVGLVLQATLAPFDAHLSATMEVRLPQTEAPLMFRFRTDWATGADIVVHAEMLGMATITPWLTLGNATLTATFHPSNPSLGLDGLDIVAIAGLKVIFVICGHLFVLYY